jgi:hypothetical protein
MEQLNQVCIDRRMQRLILCILTFFSFAGRAAGQTIQPVLAEYRGQASGRFELTNNSFLPLSVVLEPKSFTVAEDGQISYRPLDSDIHVKFSVTSFRIPPKQSFSVAYQATANALPAWFVVYAGMTGLPERTSTGMNIQILLPHTVYMLPKKDASKKELKIVSASFDKTSHVVSLDLASESDSFARVLVTQVQSGKKKMEAPGFPIYPHKHRRLDVDWKEDIAPDAAVFVLKDFKIEVPITTPAP